MKEKLKKQAAELFNPPLFKFFKRDELTEIIGYADLYVHTAEVEIEAVACLEAICGGLLPSSPIRRAAPPVILP